MSAGLCPLCGGAARFRFSRVTDPEGNQEFALAACDQCGLGWTEPRPEDLRPYYGAAYYGGRHGRAARLCARRRRRRIQQAAGRRSGLRLLDVGCGDGTLLLEAKRAGFQVFGTEMNPDLARSAGLPVAASLEEAGAWAPFDVITLWHSLEHLPDPPQTLASLRRLLAPGGVLLVAVPDARSLPARLFGPRWFHLDVPRHLWHFNRQALVLLLLQQGLQPFRSWGHEWEYDLLGWSQSLLNVLLRPPNEFFRRLTRRPPRTRPAVGLLHLGLGFVLSICFLPPVLILAATRRGGTLVAAARPDVGFTPGTPA